MYILSIVFLLLLAFMFGASIASFTGVLIERLPKHETILGYSHCSCGRPLKWYENIPVIGWLRVNGTTKCCKTRLPIWYVISETFTGILAVIIVAYIIL